MKDKNEDLEKNLEIMKKKCQDLDKFWQNAESSLVDARAEVQVNLMYKIVSFFTPQFPF